MRGERKMKDLFKELYYLERETHGGLLTEEKEARYETERTAYQALLNVLCDEQKRLFHAYEEICGILRTEENEELYKAAFLSGFSLAEELHKGKNE